MGLKPSGIGIIVVVVIYNLLKLRYNKSENWELFLKLKSTLLQKQCDQNVTCVIIKMILLHGTDILHFFKHSSK